MTKKMLPVVMLLLTYFASVPGALADYYKYTDGRGVVSLTNKLDSVPAKYRSTMKVIGEDPKKDSGLQKQVPQSQAEPDQTTTPNEPAAAAPARLSDGRFAQLSARFVWFKPLVYLGAALALFIAIIKVTSMLTSPLLSKLIYFSFSLALFFFLYKAYVGHLAESTQKLKDGAASVVKQSAARQERLEDETAPSGSK